MTNNNNNHNEDDKGLIKLIGLLRPTPPRDPKVVEQNRLKFLAEADNLIGTDGKLPQKNKFYQFQSKEKTNMNGFKPKFALTTLFVIVTLFVFLFGGTGLTVYAAQSALPGDALYPVKTGLEQTRLSLTSEADRVAQLHLSLAQKRLEEIEGLIKEGRYDQVGKTSAEFERQIQLAVEALKSLANQNPARAAELTTQMMAELSTYTKALTSMLVNLPEEVKVEVEKAIVGSESAGALGDSAKSIELTGVVSNLTAESWTIMGRVIAVTPQTELKGTFAVGDTVKVHAMVNADGSLTALEIEAGAAVDNGNDNLNANDNSNANENVNSNANENGNENSNENSNENENENSNGNSNENENENANDNSNANNRDEDEFEFKGTVQTILPDLWVIGGITVAVSPETSLRGTIAVGDTVEVKAFELPDGSLLAIEIKLEDGSSNDNGDDHIGDDQNSNNNSNENGDDHGSEIENSNDSDGEHDGGDDSSNNSSEHAGSNDNGGDDSGGGSGGGGGGDNGGGD
jgi:uncharacterized membrane protein YgcG